MGTLCTFGITVILDKVLKTMRFVKSRDEQHQHNRLKYIAHLNIILYIQTILNVSVLFPVHQSRDIYMYITNDVIIVRPRITVDPEANWQLEY